MAPSPHRRIAAFLLLTFALSSIFYVQIARAGQMKMLPVAGLMWCPGAAALLVRLFTQGNLRDEGWRRGPVRWLVRAYLLPPSLCLVVYGLVWLTGIGGFSGAALATADASPRPLIMLIVILAIVGFRSVLLYATVGFLSGLVFTLGEELGWRGFLVPELARITTFTRTSLISGAVWSVYHYPLILFANYHSGTPKWFTLAAFTWMVVASSFVYAWLRLKSGSVWPAAFLHASHNLFVQQIFDPLTTNRAITPYVTTEFGIGLALAYTMAAIYCWTRRSEAPMRPRSS